VHARVRPVRDVIVEYLLHVPMPDGVKYTVELIKSVFREMTDTYKGTFCTTDCNSPVSEHLANPCATTYSCKASISSKLA
jgi:hypothetical protein